MDIAQKSVPLCRGCLREIELEQYSFGWPEIKDLFVQCTSIAILPDEQGLPQQICLECYTNCERWFSFKTMCVEVDTHLQTTVPCLQPVTDYQLPIRIKEEVIDDDDPMEYNTEATTFSDDLDTFSFGNLVADTQDFSPVVLLERLDPKLIARLTPKSVMRAPAACEIKTCPVCQLRCPDPARLMVHLKEHYSKDNPQCPLCSKSFKRTSKIYPHIMSQHMVDTHIENPIRAEDQAAKLECPICKKKFEKLHLHLAKEHSGFSGVSCPICDKVCNSKKDLRYHLVIHTGEKTCACPLCGLTFKHDTSLWRHKRQVHGIGIQINHEANEEAKHSDNCSECKLCGKLLNSAASLDRHKKFIHGIQMKDPSPKKKCPICAKKFQHLCLHLSKAHVKPGDRSCPICKKVFKKKLLLNYHLVVHTDETPYQCDLCPQSFKFGSSMGRHKKRVHAIVKHEDKEEVKFQCKFLPDNSLDRDKTVIHGINRPNKIDQNEDDPPAKKKCPICKKKFERLWPHLAKAHVKPGDRSCPICKKVIKENAKLKHHLVKHTDETPYQCDLCPQSFSFGTSLRRHKKSVHAIVKHEAEEHVDGRLEGKLCGKFLYSAASLGGRKSVVHDINSKLHSSINPKPQSDVKSEIDGDSCIECPLCDAEFSHLKHLTAHFVVHTNERPYQCMYCQEDFRSRANVSRHLTQCHSKKNRNGGFQIKPGSAFLSPRPWESMGFTVADPNAVPDPQPLKSKLPLKTLEREGETRYCCQACNADFSTKRALSTHHQNFHLPFHCGRCKKTFPTDIALKGHSLRCAKVVVKQESVNVDEILPCPYCHRQFIMPSTLKRHIRSYHQDEDQDEHEVSTDSGVVVAGPSPWQVKKEKC